MKKIILVILSAFVTFTTVDAQCSFTPTITGTDPTCTQQTVRFNTEPGNSNYQWTVTGGGAFFPYGINSDSVYVFINTAGAKSISVSYTKDGCTASSTVRNFTVAASPVAQYTASPSSSFFCSGDVVTYTAPIGAGISSYQWFFPTTAQPGLASATLQSGSLTSNSITIQWATTDVGAQGLVSLSYLDASQNGCRSVTSINSTVNKRTTTTVTGNSTLCVGAQGLFTAVDADGLATNISWSTDGGTIIGAANQRTVNILWGTSGVKTVSVTFTRNGGQCGAVIAGTPQQVTVNALPNVSILTPPQDPVCVNTPIVYTATGLTNYQWTIGNPDYTLNSGGLTSSTLDLKWTNNTLSSFNLFVFGTDANGCTRSALRTIGVKGPGISTPAGATACLGGTTVLNADESLSNATWSLDTGGTLSPTTGLSTTVTWTTTPGPRTITLTASGTVDGCTVTPANPIIRKAFIAPAPDLPTFSQFGTSNSTCVNTAMGFRMNSFPPPAGTYTWSVTAPDAFQGTPPTQTTTSQTPIVLWGNTTGSRTVTLTATNLSGCSTTNQQTYTITTPPALTITGSNVICAGTGIHLTANGGAAPYTWLKDGGVISGETGATLPVLAATAGNAYTVQWKNASGCLGTSPPFPISVVTPDPISLSPVGPISICPGGSTTLTATGGSAPFLWSLNESVISEATSSTYNATEAGDYVVYYSTSGCTKASNTVTVSVRTPPNVTLTNSGPNIFCQPISVSAVLNAGGGSEPYVWEKDGSVISDVSTTSYTATTTGTYKVKWTDANGCTGVSDPIVISAPTPPTITITPGGATTFCAGGSVVLTASGGATPYVWRNNGTVITGASNPTYPTNATGNYTASWVDTNGCTGTSSAIAVTVKPYANTTIHAGGATTFCPGGSVVLSVTDGDTWQWKRSGTVVTGATAQSYTVTLGGDYTCVIGKAGCNMETPIPKNVTVYSNPTVAISLVGPLAICPGGSATLTATTGLSNYDWKLNGSSLGVASSQTYPAGVAGSYTVTGTNANGCSSTSAAVSVTENSSPTITISPSGSVGICTGTSRTLTASGGSTPYVWKKDGVVINGQTSNTISANAAALYTASWTDTNGCTGTSAPTTIILKPYANTTINAGGPTTFCSGGSVVLSVTDGDTWQWKRSGAVISGATSQSYTATLGGSYTCVIGKAGCSMETPIPKDVTVIPQGQCEGALLAAPTTTSTPTDTESPVGEMDEVITTTTISPNPASTEINLKTVPRKGNSKLSLMNLQGLTVRTSQLAAGDSNATIPLGSLADGMYLFIIESGITVERHKVLIRQ